MKGIILAGGTESHILLKEVHDPQGNGVVELYGESVISIEDKPEEPKSNFGVTSIYFYDTMVFDSLKKLKPSGKGALEIRDANNFYIEQGNMKSSLLSGWWTEAEAKESYKYANKLGQNNL